MNRCVWTDAEADVSPYTTNAFRRVVSSLPTPYDAEIVATRAAYEQFFGQWGPYYVKQLGAGGAVRISMNVESSLVDTESHTTAEIEAQIGASYSVWSAGAHASQTSSRTHISDEVTEGTLSQLLHRGWRRCERRVQFGRLVASRLSTMEWLCQGSTRCRYPNGYRWH